MCECLCVCVCTWLRSHTCPGEIIKTENKTNLKNYRFISQCDRRVDWWLVRPLLAAMTYRVLAAMTLVLAAVTCRILAAVTSRILAAVTCRILAAMMSSAHDLLFCRKAFSPSSCMNNIYVRDSYRCRSMVFGISSSSSSSSSLSLLIIIIIDIILSLYRTRI